MLSRDVFGSAGKPGKGCEQNKPRVIAGRSKPAGHDLKNVHTGWAFAPGHPRTSALHGETVINLVSYQVSGPRPAKGVSMK